MNAIEFRNVSKKFRKGEKFDSLRDFIPNLVKGMFNGKNGHLKDQEFWAVKDVSFELKRGETLGIIGPNGAGKSTILKMLSKILKPTKGEMNINGNLSALLEVGSGFHPDLTGRENIYLSGAIIGMKRKEIEKNFDSIVEFSGLEDFIDTPVKRYSSGMYVRLGFSVAAHMEPEILLIDEVLSVGDMNFQMKGMQKIHELRKSGATIIFISHSLDAVLGLCQRTILMHKGQAQFDGDTDEAIRRYKDIVLNKKENRIGRSDSSSLFDTDHSVSKAPAKITGVEFLDTDGKTKDSFSTGKTMVIRIKFLAKEKITKPVFGIEIHKSDGLYIQGSSTNFDKYKVDEIYGNGAIEVRYNSLNLLDGDYFVSAGIYDESGLAAYDFQDKKYNFSIKHSFNDHGVVFLNHEWSLIRDEILVTERE